MAIRHKGPMGAAMANANTKHIKKMSMERSGVKRREGERRKTAKEDMPAC
jgi:hypothetical protein